MPDCYKIKLRESGHRLVYRVDSGELVIVVLAAGKRERSEVYEIAGKRFNARPTEYRGRFSTGNEPDAFRSGLFLAGAGHEVHVVTSRQRYDDAAAGLPLRERIDGVQV